MHSPCIKLENGRTFCSVNEHQKKRAPHYLFKAVLTMLPVMSFKTVRSYIVAHFPFQRCGRIGNFPAFKPQLKEKNGLLKWTLCQLTNSMAYGTWRLNVAFTRPFNNPYPEPNQPNFSY